MFQSYNYAKGLIITQPKLNNSDRIIIPEKPFFTSRRHKSLKNWIDHWRPKVENQYSGNYLYLKPDGKPFTKDAMRMMLTRATRKIDPNYRPYNVRHWCAIARLIEWDLNIIKVRDFLGHEKIETTMGYLRTAKQFYNRDNRSWLKRMLRSNRGQNPLKSAEKNCINRIGKTKVWPENLHFTWNFSLCDEWARQGVNLPTGGNLTNNLPILRMLIFERQLNLLFKPLFLFFYRNLRYITFHRTLYHVMEVHDF